MPSLPENITYKPDEPVKPTKFRRTSPRAVDVSRFQGLAQSLQPALQQPLPPQEPVAPEAPQPTIQPSPINESQNTIENLTNTIQSLYRQYSGIT